MAVNPYYVGSNLSDIGRFMSQDRATDAQLRAAELQARNQFAQIIQQAMQAQANRSQQGDQFNQDLAFRNAALAQRGDLSGRELDQDQSQFAANQAWMREQLKAELANRLELGKMGQGRMDSQVLAALINQQAITGRGEMERNEQSEFENQTAQALASQYNTVLEPLKAAAKSKAADGFMWGTRDATEDKYKQVYRSVLDPEISRLVQSIQGQPIIFNAATERFEPVARRQPTASTQQLPPQLMQLLQSITGTNAPAAISTTTAGGIPPELAQILQAIAGTSTSTNVNSPLTNAAPPQITQPKFVPGRIYQQGDKSYRFDGTNFIEVVSGQ